MSHTSLAWDRPVNPPSVQQTTTAQPPPVITQAAATAGAVWQPQDGSDPITRFSAKLASPADVVLDANGQTGQLRFNLPLRAIQPPVPPATLQGANLRVAMPPGNKDVTPATVATVNGERVPR
jgi:hypothetical protein